MNEAEYNDRAMSDESDDEDSSSMSGEESDSTERMDLLRKELADIPFEDLDKMETQLRKTKSEETTSGTTMDKRASPKKKEKEIGKSDLFAENRKKKDSRPLEMSSKQRPSKFRKVVAGGNKMTRDPRFDDLSGKLNHELFKKSYAFLDEIKEKEKKEVRQRLKREKNAEKKAELHKLLQKLEQNEKKEKEDEHRKEKHREIKKKEMEAIKQGKKPYFLKKSEKKKLELAEQYKTLKSDGKLEKYLSKKRKRNAAKDRRHLPKIRTQNS
eukprot:Seg2116.2 transcript_id=Seg2116.2/GoldUCD/mRNA.D3Y31 product="Ribosomal RNA processing protein 36-like" protein_id=Seg2116.2/GoldUCD/D3Y31